MLSATKIKKNRKFTLYKNCSNLNARSPSFIFPRPVYRVILPARRPIAEWGKRLSPTRHDSKMLLLAPARQLAVVIGTTPAGLNVVVDCSVRV
ncbi:hypothetical protein J6590_084973 [Homalodisca vitripennis]|nr:hypothetical protein J6590_084973 [Homalodisca vitripennis]